MKKIIDRYLFIIPILLIPPNFQVFSRNQPLYRFIINKKEQQATFALQSLAKEELYNGDYKVDLNISFLHSLRSDVNHYFLKKIYLSQLKFYLLQSGDTKFI